MGGCSLPAYASRGGSPSHRGLPKKSQPPCEGAERWGAKPHRQGLRSTPSSIHRQTDAVHGINFPFKSFRKLIKSSLLAMKRSRFKTVFPRWHNSPRIHKQSNDINNKDRYGNGLPPSCKP